MHCSPPMYCVRDLIWEENILAKDPEVTPDWSGAGEGGGVLYFSDLLIDRELYLCFENPKTSIQ